MRNLITSLIAVLVCLTFASGTRGQYRWKVTHPNFDGTFNYQFTSVDCYGTTCTAFAIRRDETLKTNDRNVQMFFRSTDGGETWKEQDPGLLHQKSDGFAYITQVEQIDSLDAVGIGDSGLIVRTFDGGNTWVKQTLNTTADVKSVHFSDPLTGIVTLWMNDQNNILTTSDGGTNWSFAPFAPWLAATMCHSDGGEKFRAITYENGPVYLTSDDWETVDSTPLIFPFSGAGDTGIVGGCAFRGLDTLVAYGESGVPPQRPLIMTSIDGGIHWTINGLQYNGATNVLCMSSLERDIVFAGGLGEGRDILRSTDHGMTWNNDSLVFSSDTIPPIIWSVAVTSDDHVNAVIGGPSYVGTELALEVPANLEVQTLPVIVLEMKLYPNPTSSSITITSLESGCTFHLLDVLGRELVNGLVPISGSLTLDVSSLSSGLYYITDGVAQAKFVKE